MATTETQRACRWWEATEELFRENYVIVYCDGWVCVRLESRKLIRGHPGGPERKRHKLPWRQGQGLGSDVVEGIIEVKISGAELYWKVKKEETPGFLTCASGWFLVPLIKPRIPEEEQTWAKKVVPRFEHFLLWVVWGISKEVTPSRHLSIYVCNSGKSWMETWV